MTGIRSEKGFSVWRQIADLFNRGLALVRAILLEIFDEAGYLRFLERRGVVSSREAYAEFLREGQATRERRARCC